MLNKLGRKLLGPVLLCCRAENQQLHLRNVELQKKRCRRGEELCCIMPQSRLKKQAVDKRSTAHRHKLKPQRMLSPLVPSEGLLGGKLGAIKMSLWQYLWSNFVLAILLLYSLKSTFLITSPATTVPGSVACTVCKRPHWTDFNTSRWPPLQSNLC